MKNMNQMLAALTGGMMPGLPSSARRTPGEGTVRSRQIMRIKKGEQEIFYYATSLRKRKK